MRKYKPSNIVPFSGLVLMCLAVLVAGIVGGGLAFLAAHFRFYVVCLAPLIMGALGAVILAASIKVGKVRNRRVAFITALLAAIAMVSVNHFAQYYFTFRDEVHTELRIYIPAATPIELDVFTEQFLEDETGSSGFWGYLQYSADRGIAFTNISGIDTNRSVPLVKGFATWIYWGIELAIIAGIGIFVVVSASESPFNEEANRWFDKPKLLGNVSWGASQEFTDKLRAVDFVGAGQMITTKVLPMPRIDIMVTRHEMELGDVLLTVVHVRSTSNGVLRQSLIESLLSQEDVRILQRNVADL